MSGFWRMRFGRRSNSSAGRSGSREGREIRKSLSDANNSIVEKPEATEVTQGVSGSFDSAPRKRAASLRMTDLLQGAGLAVLAVEHVADDLAALGVGFGLGLALKAFGGGARCCFGFRFGCAALGAAVGVAGFVRTQLELLSAEDAGFDREGHGEILNRKQAGVAMTTPAVACGRRVSRAAADLRG